MTWPSGRSPLFPGCEDAPLAEQTRCAAINLLEFVYANVRYPASARENSCEGQAVISFIVEKDGRISAAKIIRDPGCKLGKAALAAVLAMNEQAIKWHPGKQYGRNVRVRQTLPVKFKLE